MTLDEFRALDPADQLDWVANVIIGQNPRLRRGDNMPGPIMVVSNGRQVVDAERSQFDELDPETFLPKGQKTITAFSMNAKPEQVLNCHPWLDIKVGDCNYLHMYEVELLSAFGDKQPGEEVSLSYNAYIRLVKPLTKEDIDTYTHVIIRYGLSK